MEGGNDTSVKLNSLHFATQNRQKEINAMINRNNSINVPEFKSAIDCFKIQAVSEIGMNLKDGYNGDLTSCETHFVGNQMVKKMIGPERIR